MKCSCSHNIKEHKYNSELDCYDGCKACECEGFDLQTVTVDELYLGRE